MPALLERTAPPGERFREAAEIGVFAPAYSHRLDIHRERG
jgi:hypothetical protein